jgi:predicted ATP-binding protein involved in virulence
MARIQQIAVKRLFGQFNHTIPLNLDEHITIIHGPNGFGKTIILRLIHEIFNGRSLYLFRIPFNELSIVFSDIDQQQDYRELRVTKETDSQGSSRIILEGWRKGRKSAHFALSQQMREELEPSLFVDEKMRLWIMRYIPDLEQIGPQEWQDLGTGEILSGSEALDRFGHRLPPRVRSEARLELPDWWLALRETTPVHLIETQRLLGPRQGREKRRYLASPLEMEPAVVIYARELARMIRDKLAESTALSQSLDRTFPMRVLNPPSKQSAITEEELHRRLEALEKKRSRLIAAGLLDQSEAPPLKMERDLDDSTRVVLALYVEDTEKKLGIFDEIADKIELLTRIINKRFLYKQMHISKDKGFVFETEQGGELPPEALSSGEQHELVLFYQLLFRVGRGSLILIDEPELSLHIAWQRQFLKDLLEIARLVNLDIVLATHSPDIINDRWDLTVELKEPALL